MNFVDGFSLNKIFDSYFLFKNGETILNQTSYLCQTDFTGSFAALFGESSYLSNSSLIIQNSAFANAYGFTGRYLDEETSLWYFRARYFDNELGRFISRDPLGFVDGHSLYNGYFAERFAMDPSGLEIVINDLNKN